MFDPLFALAHPVDDRLYVISVASATAERIRLTWLVVPVKSFADSRLDTSAVLASISSALLSGFPIAYRTPHLSIHNVRVKDQISVLGCGGTIDAVHDVRIATKVSHDGWSAPTALTAWRVRASWLESDFDFGQSQLKDDETRL